MSTPKTPKTPKTATETPETPMTPETPTVPAVQTAPPAPPAVPSTHSARLDAMALALEAGDLDTATAAAGGQDEDLPPSHDFDADPVAVGVMLGLTLAEVEDEARPGVLDYPMILGMRTDRGIVAIWLGAHLEATMKRIANVDRAMPDRRSRGLAWRDHVNAAGRAWEGVPVVLYNYGFGPQEKGRSPARLFKVKTFLELRGLAGADLNRFCALWRSAVRAPAAPPKNSTAAADAAL